METGKTVIRTPLVSTASLFTALFLYLKLTGTLDWSWVWVFSPYWISAIIVIALLSLAIILGLFFKD